MSATETAPASTDTPTGAAWVSDLAFEGVSTGDGRYIVDGALNWRDLPLTLMGMNETPDFGGHAGAQVTGRIDAIAKDRTDLSGGALPDGVTAIRGMGVFDTGEFGTEMERLVGEQTVTGVSIDMAINEWQFRDPQTGEIIDPETADEATWERAFMGELEMAITDGTIMAATVCPTPAFADAKIALLASGTTFGRFWRANEMTARRFGIAEDALCTSLWAPIRLAPDEALTAAATAPLKPPREWFLTPEADRAVPLTITPEGRVYGHIAAWESCHTGFINGAYSQCVTPPRTRTQYAHFHVGEMPTEEGDLIPVGKLMLAHAHAPGTATRQGARTFYDQNGTVGAYLRAHDGKHGIWVAGCLKDDLTDTQRRDIHANPPSGDWRSVDGNLELIAAMSVPVPGFPIPRSQLALSASADGDVYVSALILTSDIDPTFGAEADALAAEIEGGTDGLHALIDG